VTARRIVLILVAAVATVALAWGLMEGLGRVLRAPAPDAGGAGVAPVAPEPAPSAAVPRIKATLFFTSEDGQHLVGVDQEVPLGDTPAAQARAIVDAQVAAAAPAPLVSSIPVGTTVRSLFVSDRGDVFVDLDAAVRTKHPGGSMQELLTVYTIVNAVLTNLPTQSGVQILINGREADTLAGHVDLRRPLRRYDEIVATPDQASAVPTSAPAAPPKP